MTQRSKFDSRPPVLSGMYKSVLLNCCFILIATGSSAGPAWSQSPTPASTDDPGTKNYSSPRSDRASASSSAKAADSNSTGASSSSNAGSAPPDTNAGSASTNSNVTATSDQKKSAAASSASGKAASTMTKDEKEDARAKLKRIRSMPLHNSVHEKGNYTNKVMGFSTQLPQGAQITELGDRAMRSFLTRPDSFLSFSAAAQDVSAHVDIAWFFQQVIKHLPPNWKVIRQEQTDLDGNTAYAFEAEEIHPGESTYRERIYVMRQNRILIFDVTCPMQNLKSNESLIKDIWTHLHFG